MHNSNLEFAKKVFVGTRAYGKFLSLKGLKTISDFPEDFKSLPVMNKSNYIEAYPIEERLTAKKHLTDFYMICTSSGSTGIPTLWPRDYLSDRKAIDFNYSMYQELFDVDKKSTLVVVTFGLGAWTAGMLTSRLCWEMPKKAKVSVVSPGLDREVSLRVIKELSGYYDQTVITGYPPFIIDLIRYGRSKGFDFKKVNTKIHFTSSRILESQRDKLAKLVSKKDTRSDVLGFYASSEAGIIGIETPDTISILDYANKNKNFSIALFGNPIPPSFIIYNPSKRYLEEYQGRLLLTVSQPVPLIRYDTKDRGGIFDGAHLKSICDRFNYNCPSPLYDKHFAFVYGRADAVRLLSNVYIEDILYCLEKSRIKDKFTGRFKYGLQERGLKNTLKIVIYLAKDKTVALAEKKQFDKEFIKYLAEVNPDFKMVSTGIKFVFDIQFVSETSVEYKGGKFDYIL